MKLFIWFISFSDVYWYAEIKEHNCICTCSGSLQLPKILDTCTCTGNGVFWGGYINLESQPYVEIQVVHKNYLMK